MKQNGIPLDQLDPLKQSDLERAFVTEWRRWGDGLPEPVAEYRFDDTKRQFDFAWPDHRVAIELQGGTWGKGDKRGAHSRGARYTLDCHKLNDAQLAGWILLWFTTDMLSDDPVAVVGMIGVAIEQRGVEMWIHFRV